jgi:hypothetical protein
MSNPYNNLLIKRAISPGVKTTNSTGVTIDRAEDNSFFQDAVVVVETGTITDGTHTVEVQDSDNGSSWTAVADTYLQDTEPAIVAADDDKVFCIGYLGLKRYLRVNVTVAGVTSGGAYGAIVVLGNPRRAPVVQDN